MSSISHLECTVCSKKYNHQVINRLCECGKILFAKYDIEIAKETLDENLEGRPTNIWRMSEIMPCKKKFQFTLGEGYTPLLKLKSHNSLYLKDEGINPTGSFKARGLCAAVSKGVELGIQEFVIPTAGNAGAALSAYCALTNTKSHIFMPKDAPKMIQKEIKAYGADLKLVDGLISDAGKLAKKDSEKYSWFDVSTLKEPYRAEGKKTMGLELAEEFDWSVPDVIIYPTGGGTGIVGMAKAFDELEELGIINSNRPRFVSVQSSGCAPIVNAFEKNMREANYWEDAKTLAPGLRVPMVIADYLILEAIYSTNGSALSVEDNQIISAMKTLAKQEGVFLSPEAAAPYAAWKELLENGWLDDSESVVLFGTATGFTIPSLWD